MNEKLKNCFWDLLFVLKRKEIKILAFINKCKGMTKL